MTERAGYIRKGGSSFLQWENNEFPLLCSFCMGEDQFVQMTKIPQGKQCGHCKRPFNVFLKEGRKTVNCKTCSQLRNACQICTLDLTTNQETNDYYGENNIRVMSSIGNKGIQVQQVERGIQKKIQKPQNIQEKLNQIYIHFIEQEKEEKIKEILNEKFENLKFHYEENILEVISNHKTLQRILFVFNKGIFLDGILYKISKEFPK